MEHLSGLTLALYETIFIIVTLLYLHLSSLWCNSTDLCSFYIFDFYLYQQIFVYLVIIPFIIQKMICRILQPNRDDFKSLKSFVESRGYKLEYINIVTEDKYHIGVHRIINPFFDKEVAKEPVILWHGMGGSSYQWLITSKRGRASNWKTDKNNNGVKFDSVDDSLAITLANHGYDVFLPNMRGNQYSNKHESFDSSFNSKYWDFSIDDMIKYDAPSVVDKVIEITGKKKITYIGVSMGGMIAYGLLSDHPEYNEKISNLITLGSPITLYNSDFGKYFSMKYRHMFMDPVIEYFTSNPGNICPPFVSYLFSYLVRGNLFSDADTNFNRMIKFYTCRYLLWFFGSRTMNPDRTVQIGSHVYLGIARKVFSHILQLSMTKSFDKFDYKEKNIKIYGSKNPPSYDIRNIQVQNMTLIYSRDDHLISINDGIFFRDQLKIPVNWDPIEKKNFDHYDLILGLDTAHVVNVKVLKSLHRA